MPRSVRCVLLPRQVRWALSVAGGRVDGWGDDEFQQLLPAGESALRFDGLPPTAAACLARFTGLGCLPSPTCADAGLEAEVRAVLADGDAYASASKPRIDWDDAAAREELVDSRAKDGLAALAVLDGRELADELDKAAKLLASVVGQDLEEGVDGVFRIARKVARDRVISTVDPDARHGPAVARARARQADPRWQADYRATRPKVERKLAHLMRRKHGGRRARVRGTAKVDTDFRLLAAAANLARLAVLGLHSTDAGWAVANP